MAKKIRRTDQAKADVRAIDRETALRLLRGLARFAFSEPSEFRLRLGDCRIRFHDLGGAIEILRVRHRREAYRRIRGPW